MLLQITVDNFILIQHLELGFREGYTCITGETGAGKSILLGALGLVLGQRADTQVLKDKDKKCIVEGSFAIEGYGLEQIFSENDLDFDSVSTFRREITPQGKSRAFINDTPVNLSVMKEIGEKLVDIHSQNQTLELNGATFQLAMVDAYAGNATELETYRQSYDHYQALRTELSICTEKESKAIAEREYIEFQLDELNKAALKSGEQEEAESELEILTHAEEIKTRLFVALDRLEESDPNIISSLNEALQAIDAASRYNNHLAAVSLRLDSVYIELKDLVVDIRDAASRTSFDPERIEQLSRRLDLIYHLEQKHKASSVQELLDFKESLVTQFNEIGSLEERIFRIRKELSEMEAELNQMAIRLSSKRKEISDPIEREMEKLLESLGMPAAQFRIYWEELSHFSFSGKDKVEFRFSANKGSEPREIQKVASGGELSRLMLAVKSMVVQRSLLPTIIFDEIDSGVSGEIAGKIGSILRNMSSTMQVIAITHLPQIAAKARQHLFVYKHEDDKNTVSRIRQLNEDERIIEIARMLSDENITIASRTAARELMGI
jgi:DNA repair protein RecN (Recombination protein N)